MLAGHLLPGVIADACPLAGGMAPALAPVYPGPAVAPTVAEAMFVDPKLLADALGLVTNSLAVNNFP